MDYKKVDSVVVGQPEYYRAVNKRLLHTVLTTGKIISAKIL
jgi:hypothetical protein